MPAAVKAPGSGYKALLAMTTKVADSDADAFQRITLARRATKHFEQRAVPDEILKKVSCARLRDLPYAHNMFPIIEWWFATAARKLIDRAFVVSSRPKLSCTWRMKWCCLPACIFCSYSE